MTARCPEAPAGGGPAPGTSVPVGLTYSLLEQTRGLVGHSSHIYRKHAFPSGAGGIANRSE